MIGKLLYTLLIVPCSKYTLLATTIQIKCKDYDFYSCFRLVVSKVYPFNCGIPFTNNKVKIHASCKAQKWLEAPLILCKGNLEDVLVCKVKE